MRRVDFWITFDFCIFRFECFAFNKNTFLAQMWRIRHIYLRASIEWDRSTQNSIPHRFACARSRMLSIKLLSFAARAIYVSKSSLDPGSSGS